MRQKRQEGKFDDKFREIIMQLRNTTLDDLSAIIGFTATARLAAWFGGRNLYVPEQAIPDSALASLVGMSAAKRLSAEFGLEWVAVPSLGVALRDSRYAKICELMKQDVPLQKIAEQMSMGLRRVQQLRVEFEVLGLLPGRDAEKSLEKNAPAKKKGGKRG